MPLRSTVFNSESSEMIPACDPDGRTSNFAAPDSNDAIYEPNIDNICECECTINKRKLKFPYEWDSVRESAEIENCQGLVYCGSVMK